MTPRPYSLDQNEASKGMSNFPDVFEVMHTTRAMRRLKPDPVADELIDQVLKAGLAAANGGNRQTWRFIVVKDKIIKQQIQRHYKRAFDDVISPHYASSAPPPGMDQVKYNRQHRAVEYLTEHFHEAPVWIVACLVDGEQPANRGSGASIYPAVQNMLLACRALGLGATLTTRHLFHAEKVDAILKIPDDAHSYAIVPIGYPMGHFGAVRRSIEGIIFQNTWGNM
jgi:nitroreductase